MSNDLTNFPNGITSFGAPVLPSFGFTGNVWWVKPSSGSDTADGKTPATAFKTLAAALSAATADNNDIVYLVAEDNTASGTTDYQSTGLNWNKDGVHLIGVCAQSYLTHRARIAQLSTVTTLDALFTVSASNCVIANIHVFQGVGSSTATTPVAVTVTGERNTFINCHFAGMGDDSMDVAAGRTLALTGAAETLFKNCVIGLDTVSRGTSTSEISVRTAVTRVKFEDCDFFTYAADAGFTFLDCAAASSIDRSLIFKNCLFHNAIESSATSMTEAFDTHASQGGTIVIQNCGLVGVGAAAFDASTDGVVYNVTPAAGANGDGGLAEPVD